MNLIRREPFRDIDDLFNRMLTSSWPRSRALANNGGNAIEWAPSADISETDKEFLVRAELPAVKKDDIQVTVDNDVITIRGERKQETEDKSEKHHRVERFYGTFERSFSLPPNADASAIKADSKDGVLTVRIPKAKAEKPKAIEVKVQ
ncbi:MAG TPA: Hsp20/alpha crystallin family protein [Steroidobacteraceae bacterium]|nr:Hsp20/alpha crystallin family protein [Steroidobacteraceae bacterium]HRX88675.1 Hsp20/alpha crystallin family protein [Steroidobacteraceae bacterium]